MSRLVVVMCGVFCVAIPTVCPAQVPVVQDGEPAAVVVTADNPTPVAQYAAGELIEHVREATGAALPMAVESAIPDGYAGRIFVGATDAARAQGIDPAELALEETVLRVVGGDLFIVGSEDDEADPLSQSNEHSGTLFGVYEILQRYLGVVWAWPGELGRFVPRTDTVVIADELDETIAPALAFRGIRWGYTSRIVVHGEDYDPNHERIAFSREGIERYGRDLQAYLRRHRMGRSQAKPPVGHYFSGWWETLGEEHPHWFMLNEQGERGPLPGEGTRHVAMCVSEPELHRHIIDQWDGRSPIRLGEVDARDRCRCERCRSWDAPQPEVIPPVLAHDERSFYHPIWVSDRYARFWKTIHEMAVERNPDAQVTTFLYQNYFPAPAEVTDLGPNIYGEFVPWGDDQVDFFPMTEGALEWLKEQWIGWSETGITMSYRPNYMHDGYTMPHLDTRQAAEFFKFAFEHGMIGTDFDSLTGQWATQGPKLYVHMRLNADPRLELDRILDEYYSVFGPAAEHVRDYFGYWEDYAVEHHQHIIDLFREVGNRWQRFPLKAHEAYPPECFPPAEALLEAAHQAAADADPEYLARVEFLQAGLEHAKLCGQLAALFDGSYNIPRDSERFGQARELLRELVSFRRAHEHMYISDYAYGAAWREVRRWNINSLFD
ncbi:MAG: DUF4838 domain-containing protein [Armatimonadota bacterium]|jgi:hypothetical protein